jgi:hypothetical protein
LAIKPRLSRCVSSLAEICRSSCHGCGARRLALTAFLANPSASAGQCPIWAISSEEERRCASFDGLGHFRFKLMDLQIELDGNRGETCLSVETRQGLGKTGSLLVSAGKGGRILTHGTFSENGKPRWIVRERCSLNGKRPRRSV